MSLPNSTEFEQEAAFAPTPDVAPRTRKPRADIYTVLLAIALVAILVTTVVLYLESADYGDQKTKGAPSAVWNRPAAASTFDAFLLKTRRGARLVGQLLYTKAHLPLKPVATNAGPLRGLGGRRSLNVGRSAKRGDKRAVFSCYADVTRRKLSRSRYLHRLGRKRAAFDRVQIVDAQVDADGDVSHGVRGGEERGGGKGKDRPTVDESDTVLVHFL